MFNLPLHPLVVHFPIVLGTLLPIFGILVWWGIKQKVVPQKAWSLVVIFAFVYTVSSLVAVELGEKDEEIVEKIISERVIEEHEEAGELIPWIGGTLFIFSLIGYIRKKSDRLRLTLAILSLLAVYPLIETGHTGGKLVYKYGAVIAHLPLKQKESLPIENFEIGSESEREHRKDELDKDKDND
jgi:uncharacterized membrane protein